MLEAELLLTIHCSKESKFILTRSSLSPNQYFRYTYFYQPEHHASQTNGSLSPRTVVFSHKLFSQRLTMYKGIMNYSFQRERLLLITFSTTVTSLKLLLQPVAQLSEHTDKSSTVPMERGNPTDFGKSGPLPNINSKTHFVILHICSLESKGCLRSQSSCVETTMKKKTSHCGAHSVLERFAAYALYVPNNTSLFCSKLCQSSPPNHSFKIFYMESKSSSLWFKT